MCIFYYVLNYCFLAPKVEYLKNKNLHTLRYFLIIFRKSSSYGISSYLSKLTNLMAGTPLTTSSYLIESNSYKPLYSKSLFPFDPNSISRFSFIRDLICCNFCDDYKDCFYLCSYIVLRCSRFCFIDYRSFKANYDGFSDEGSIVLSSTYCACDVCREFARFILFSRVAFVVLSFSYPSGNCYFSNSNICS